jgi:hypothetical protein
VHVFIGGGRCLARRILAAPRASVRPGHQQYGTSFVAAVNAVMVSLEGSMLTMATGAVVFLLIAGVLLYYSGLGKRHGKQFIEGGVIIAVFMAFGVPYLVHAYC